MREYISHRQEVITRRATYDVDKARRRAHVLEGIVRALDHIDEIIAIIRASSSTEDARNNLMEAFDFSEIQANAILDVRLARLAALEKEKIVTELAEVLAEILRLESLLGDPDQILGVIRDDMAYLKEKYGDERRSRILDVSPDISAEDLVPEVDVVVTITNRGYVKRLTEDTYRTQHRGGKGVTGVTMREEDGVQHMMFANSMDSLLVFTNRGKVYHVKVHEIPETSRTAKGMPIINIVNMLPDETVTTLLKVRDFTEGKYLFFTTRNGTVKRVELSQFQAVRSTGLIAISLDENDELAWVQKSSGDDDVVIVTEKGMAIRFQESDVRPMGRPAAGVRGIRLADGDRIIASEIATPEMDMLVVSANGFGKRTALKQFKVQNRGGKGVTGMKVTPKTGDVVGARMVTPEHTVLLISSGGQIIRMPVSQINLIGRATQGVTVMRPKKGETVVSMTVAEPRLEEPTVSVADQNGHETETPA